MAPGIGRGHDRTVPADRCVVAEADDDQRRQHGDVDHLGGDAEEPPFPLAEDGALVVRPEVRWGAGHELSGDEVALFLPRDGLSLFEEESKVGVPTVTTQSYDHPR